ncbi:MAG: tetratricopeptide repeat protein, partial [Cyclobacteriaceae bacterium]
MTLLLWALSMFSTFACQDKRLSYQINEAPKVDSSFYVQALDALDNAIAREPNNADAYFKKALYENKLGNINTAFSNINRALIFDKNNPDYLFLEAQIYKQQGEDSLALQNALLVENLGAGNPQLWRLISDLYYQQEQYIRALQYNGKAISLYPNGPYHYQQGLCLLAMQDTAEAKKSFLKTLDQDQFRYETLMVLSALEIQSKRYDQAFQYLALNLETNAESRPLHYDLGVLLTLTNQPDSAQ